LAVAGSFGEADAAGHDGFKDFFVEELPQIAGDLAG
jgi:hypothetical protein